MPRPQPGRRWRGRGAAQTVEGTGQLHWSPGWRGYPVAAVLVVLAALAALLLASQGEAGGGL